MGVCDGCTSEEFAQIEASFGLDFEPRGTKKTLSELLNRQIFNDTHYRKLGEQQLNKMAEQRFMLIERDKSKYIFSKDSEGNYSWQPATRFDVLKYHLRRPLFHWLQNEKWSSKNSSF